MEETRIGVMYWNLLKKRMVGLWDFAFQGGALGSGTSTITVLAVIVGAAVLFHHERGKGHLVRLQQTIGGGAAPVAVSTPQPGGQDPLVLRRSAPSEPERGLEFASVTTLPGLGMGIQQISIYLPGGEETTLLASPTVDAMAQGDHPFMGGSFDLPWTGILGGSAVPNGQGIANSWEGHSFVVPVAKGRNGVGVGGMLADAASEGTTPNIVPNGQSATASFEGTDFGGHWPGTTRTKVSVLLEGSRMEFSVIVTNVGTGSEPIGIGWHPRFAIPASQDPKKVIVRLPESTVEETGGARMLPTGKIVAARPAVSRFMGGDGATVGESALDDLLTEMKPALLEDGASAEIRFPGAGYGLRMRMVSPSIRAMRVVSAPEERVVSLGPQTNLDDPLGAEWANGSAAGMITLSPGQSAEWKVKLELFQVPKPSK